MKVFVCSLLGLMLLCSTVHSKFVHSQQYLERLAEEQELRNRLTMEQSWERRYSHARVNSNSGISQPCGVVRPQPEFNTAVDSAVTVCKIDGVVCHQSKLFPCCGGSSLFDERRAVVPGGATVDVDGSQVSVEFFYSGGGYGSGVELSLCYRVDSNSRPCDRNVFGCDSRPSCGPSTDICLNNIVENTCDPDPNQGGCQCQTGYLAPNCCRCDVPNFHERLTGVDGEFTCERTCRMNCVGSPTRLGCSQCKQGYQGSGCCQCAPGYITVKGKCVRGCEGNCSSRALFDPVSGCSECLPGYQAPTCCQCDHHYLLRGRECFRVCDHNCERDHYSYTHGCSYCKQGYASTPFCCDCEQGLVKDENGQCFRPGVCKKNCVDDPVNPVTGCSQCKPGYRGAPECCECAEGFVRNADGDCVKDVCDRGCVADSFDPINGCSQCRTGYRGAPECCMCAEGFTRDAYGDCVKEVCDQCISTTFNSETGCGGCQTGFAPPTCCECEPPYVKVGTECIIPCATNCQNSFFTEGVGCAPGRCREGHQAPPLCCNCTADFMQPFFRAPCTRIPTCDEDERLENGVCVPICREDQEYNTDTQECDPKCKENETFNQDSQRCEPACGGNEDIVFLLDYSTSFRPIQMRGIIGNLQLISNAFNSRPNIRDAAVHYRIRPSRIRPERNNILSNFIYDYDSTCTNTRDQLDKFAGRTYIDNRRSFFTESYSALNFAAREVPFTSGRRTTFVTITDGFSRADDSNSRIETEIRSIERKAENADATVRFLSIGVVQSNQDETRVRAELKALANGFVPEEDNYVDYPDFSDALLDLLVGSKILCPQDRTSIRNTLTDDNGQVLRNYIECSDQDSNSRSCGTDEFKITCSSANTMGDQTGKSSLMTEILAAVQGVFNEAFQTE